MTRVRRYARMPPDGRVPVQAAATARPAQTDGDHPAEALDTAGRSAAAPGRPRARMWAGQSNYAKQEYRPLPSAPKDEPETAEQKHSANDKAQPSRSPVQRPAGANTPHKKRKKGRAHV